MIFYIIVMIGIGTFLAIQPAINAALSRHTGPLEASFVSFFTGSVCLLMACLFFGKGSILKVIIAPIWQWIGGLLGAAVVCSAVIAVPRIGVLSASLAMILGNLAMASLIDNYGWFDTPIHPFTMRRLFGIILMICGLYFVSLKK